MKLQDGRHWRSAMAVVLIAALGLAVLGSSGCSKKVANPAAKVETAPAEWTAVRLVDGAEYFGKLVRIDDRFAALDDAYFLTSAAPETGGTGRIKRFGGEIHRPAAQIVFPVESVLYEQPLDSTSATLDAIREFESQNTTLSAPPKASVPSGELLCIVLRSGDVFFANVTVVSDTASLSNVHYLRFKNKDAASSGEIQNLDQLVLVPQRTTAVGPTGDMQIPLSSVLYFQFLSEDSPVEKAMK